MHLRTKVHALLDEVRHSLRSLDPAPLVLGALVLGILAQASLAWSSVLVAGSLFGIGCLLLVSSLLVRRHTPSRGEKLSILFFAMALVGGGLAFKILPSFLAAVPLYTLAVILFVVSAGKRFETASQTSEPITRLEVVLLALIVILGFVLQGYRVAEIPPGFHGDEAESGMQALQLLHGQVQSLISVGWYHLPMLSFVWHAVSMIIFGDTVYGLRMSSVIVGTLTLIPFYALTRLLFNRNTALLATFLLAVAHSFIALNRLGINYTQTTLFEVVAFYLLFRGLRSRRWWDFALSGLFLGVGLYLYYASRLVPFIVLGFLVLAAVTQRGFLRAHWRGIVVLWLVAITVFAPMAVYFLQHPWYFISRTSHVFVLGTQGWVDTPYARENVATTLLGQAARVLPLFNYGGDMSGQYGYKGSMLDFFTALFFVLGMGYSFAHAGRLRHMFLLLWFWATMIVGGMLTLPAPFIPRLAGMLPVLCIFAAVAIEGILNVLLDAWRQSKATRAMLGSLVAITLVVSAYLNCDTYFNKYLPTIQGWAMREPATAIARYMNSLGDDYKVYLLGAPKLYVRHGTIRFIARDADAMDVLDPTQYIPLRSGGGKNAAFILLPSHLHHLSQLQQYYPKGVVRNFTRDSGELWFTVFEISEADIAAALSSPSSP
jgi:4-amino-4-deoxy-L-arabinose transferase-like glycosyltransferase